MKIVDFGYFFGLKLYIPLNNSLVMSWRFPGLRQY